MEGMKDMIWRVWRGMEGMEGMEGMKRGMREWEGVGMIDGV